MFQAELERESLLPVLQRAHHRPGHLPTHDAARKLRRRNEVRSNKTTFSGWNLKTL